VDPHVRYSPQNVGLARHDDASSRDHYRHEHPMPIRADGAGYTKAFLAHVGSPREQGNCEFSVGWTITTREHTAGGVLAAVGDRP
jgi:hypothetical protein